LTSGRSVPTGTNAYAGSGSEGEKRRDPRPAVPAYGPVEAFLGFVLFLLVVERATPVVVSVVTDALPEVSPSTVGFGLATFAWFALAATVADQATRKLAALGIGPREAKRLDRTAGILSEPRALGYLAAALLGGAVAVLTFERGVGTAVASTPGGRPARPRRDRRRRRGRGRVFRLVLAGDPGGRPAGRRRFQAVAVGPGLTGGPRLPPSEEFSGPSARPRRGRRRAVRPGG
jgi:hypothetical protein